MEREFKYRPPGIIFFLILVVMLLLSKSGLDLIAQLQKELDTSDALAALVGAGILLFTSEGVGYLFSSIVYAFFNARGGYSSLFRLRLAYGDIRARILDLYSSSDEPTGPLSADAFNESLPRMSDEALNVYFFWYRDKHDNPLDDWLIRRYTAYFTALSSAVAVVLANLIGLIVISTQGFGFTCSNVVWIVVSLLFIVCFYINGRNALDNALQALDLWIAGATNPRFVNTLNSVHPLDEDK